MFYKKAPEPSSHLMDQIVQYTDEALSSGRRKGNDALDSVVEGVRELRHQAQLASDKTVTYIKDEPVKVMVMAAVTAAAVAALVYLLRRPRD